MAHLPPDRPQSRFRVSTLIDNVPSAPRGLEIVAPSAESSSTPRRPRQGRLRRRCAMNCAMPAAPLTHPPLASVPPRGLTSGGTAAQSQAHAAAGEAALISRRAARLVVASSTKALPRGYAMRRRCHMTIWRAGARSSLPRVSRNQFNAGRKCRSQRSVPGDMLSHRIGGASVHYVGRARGSRGIIRGAKWNELGWAHVARDDSRATAGAGRGSVRRNAATF
jgi:hypothetical protein